MTLKLMIMRHAESAAPSQATPDHERPLTPQGQASVARVAQTASSKGWHPELIFASDAKRTVDTCDLFAAELEPLPQIEKTNALYQASPAEIVDFIGSKNPPVKTLQIIGHNPTMESFLEHLSHEFVDFAPTNLALLTHDGDNWARAIHEAGAWKLTQFISAT